MNARRLRAVSVAIGAMATLLTASVARAQTIVACVGDSITAGTWPSDLGTDLGSAYTVDNYGVPGTTLLKNGSYPYWNTQQYTDSHTVGPDIVVIMLGTNDSMPQNWSSHSGEFVGDYEALVDTYTALASKPRIFLNLPPPATDNNQFSISGTTIANEILPLIRQVAANKGVGLIDVFSAFGGPNFDSTLYIGDGVHPSATGAQKIADTVYAAITAPPDAGTGLTDAALTPDDAAISIDAAGGTEGSAPGSGGASGAPDSGGVSSAPDTGASSVPDSGHASGAPNSGSASGAPDSGGSAGSQGLPGSGGSSSTTGAGDAGGSSGVASNPPANQSGCSSSLATVPVGQGATWSIALLVATALRRRRSA